MATSITTTTITSTVVQMDASTTTTTTLTSTQTSTVTPTTVTTSTATATVVVAAATYYAACAANNQVGTVNGQGINYLRGDDSSFSTADSTVYDCCIACFNSPTCPFFGFYGGFPAGQQCYVGVSANNVRLAQTQDQIRAVLGQTAGQGYFLGNGNCGEISASSNY